MEETLIAMNFNEKIIDLVLLLYSGSEAITVTNDKKVKDSRLKEV